MGPLDVHLMRIPMRRMGIPSGTSRSRARVKSMALFIVVMGFPG
jgi:hypothetical protein